MRRLVSGLALLGLAACAGQSKSSNPSAVAAHCNEKGETLELSSIEALERHLIGRWTFCGGTPPAHLAHDGIEFAADGRWYFLQSDGSGALTRRRGFDASGRWHPGAFAMTPPTLQPTIDVHIGQQVRATSVAFQGQPSAMRMDWGEGPVDYVASDERPLYAGPLPPAPPPSFSVPLESSHAPLPDTGRAPSFACAPSSELQLGRLFFEPEVDYVARHVETWIPNGKHIVSEERGAVCGKAKNRSACLAALARVRDSVVKPARCHDEPQDPACSLRTVVITRGNDARVLRSAAEVRAQLGRIDSREEARWLLELEHQGTELCYAHSDEAVAPFRFTFVPQCAYGPAEQAFVHHVTVDVNGGVKETREPTTDPAARRCNRSPM